MARLVRIFVAAAMIMGAVDAACSYVDYDFVAVDSYG